MGQLDNIDVVAKPAADKSAVQSAIARALPPGVEVVTGQTVLNEQTSAINRALSFFSTALLVFAFISLFIGAFTIFNTFSITVGQRARELALLRVVGASRRQVFGSVLAEAGVAGALSSVVGIGLGVLAAAGLEALMSGLGYTLPSGPLGFEARTAIVGLAVGIGVTVISAIGSNPPFDLLILGLLLRSVVAPGCLNGSTGADGDKPERLAQWATDLGYHSWVVGISWR